MAMMDIELPVVAATLMSKQARFDMMKDSLNVNFINIVHSLMTFRIILNIFQYLIKLFLRTVKQVKLEVRPLFLPQLVQLTSLLKPGLHSIKVGL